MRQSSSNDLDKSRHPKITSRFISMFLLYPLIDRYISVCISFEIHLFTYHRITNTYFPLAERCTIFTGLQIWLSNRRLYILKYIYGCVYQEIYLNFLQIYLPSHTKFFRVYCRVYFHIFGDFCPNFPDFFEIFGIFLSSEGPRDPYQLMHINIEL